MSGTAPSQFDYPREALYSESSLDHGIGQQFSSPELPANSQSDLRSIGSLFDPSDLVTLDYQDHPQGELPPGDATYNDLALGDPYMRHTGIAPTEPYAPGYFNAQPGWQIPAISLVEQSSNESSTPGFTRGGANHVFTISRPSETACTTSNDGTLYDALHNALPAHRGPSRPRQYSFISEPDLSSKQSSHSSAQRTATAVPIDAVWDHRYPQYLPVPPPVPRSQGPASDYSASLASAPLSGKEKKQCPECKHWLVDLRRHRATHNANQQEVKREQCPECPRSFKNPKDLRRHQLKHSSRKHFQCNFQHCGQLLQGRMDNATRHVIQQHKVDKAFASMYITASQAG